MTADELQRIASVLSNQCYVRYWLHYNYPAAPSLMAIAARDHEGPVELPDLKGRGFEETISDDIMLYTIQRTTDDGSPWVSKL